LTVVLWISLATAVAVADSFEALLPHLRESRIPARAASFDGGKGGEIPTAWWFKIVEIGVALGWARFLTQGIIEDGTFMVVRLGAYEILATGIELDAAAVEARFLTKPDVRAQESLTKSARAGGRPGPKGYDEMWPLLWLHLESVVASEQKKFDSLSKAARAGADWLRQTPKLPLADPDTIRAKLRETRPDLLEKLIAPNSSRSAPE
jgi:hypothetical protein